MAQSLPSTPILSGLPVELQHQILSFALPTSYTLRGLYDLSDINVRLRSVLRTSIRERLKSSRLTLQTLNAKQKDMQGQMLKSYKTKFELLRPYKCNVQGLVELRESMAQLDENTDLLARAKQDVEVFEMWMATRGPKKVAKAPNGVVKRKKGSYSDTTSRRATKKRSQ